MKISEKSWKPGLTGVIKTISIIVIPIIILVFFILKENWNRWGMWNDNQRQWIHIMDRALSNFFSGKGMPLYDFFNYGGVEIFDEGYYGLYNPLIWIAWLLGKALCSETMPVYIYLCIILGNLAVYLITRELDVPYFNSFLIVLLYMFVPTLYNPGNWYFVWMNYWIVPMLVFSVMVRDRLSKVMNILLPSLLLLASILSGNSQYTVMHFISWAGICLILFVKNYKNACVWGGVLGFALEA